MIEIVAQQVWLVPGATDMRKSIDALVAIVRYAIQQGSQPAENPFLGPERLLAFLQTLGARPFSLAYSCSRQRYMHNPETTVMAA